MQKKIPKENVGRNMNLPSLSLTITTSCLLGPTVGLRRLGPWKPTFTRFSLSPRAQLSVGRLSPHNCIITALSIHGPRLLGAPGGLSVRSHGRVTELGDHRLTLPLLSMVS